MYPLSQEELDAQQKGGKKDEKKPAAKQSKKGKGSA